MKLVCMVLCNNSILMCMMLCILDACDKWLCWGLFAGIMAEREPWQSVFPEATRMGKEHTHEDILQIVLVPILLVTMSLFMGEPDYGRDSGPDSG